MKNNGKLWFLVGSIPYVISFIYSIISIFMGVSNCLLSKKYGLCETVYGFRAFGQVWYMWLYTLYPVFLVFLFFMILGYTKRRMNMITRSRMLLLFGASPFALSLCLFLFACLASPESNIASLFSSIFVNHFFIVFSDLIGLIFIFVALANLRKIQNKNHKKDVI